MCQLLFHRLHRRRKPALHAQRRTLLDGKYGASVSKALESGVRAANTLAVALSLNTDISSDYAASVFADFEDYKSNRNHFYQIEQR